MAKDSKVEELIQRFAHEYDGLSKQLKLVAQYISAHRQQMVVVRIRDVAQACRIQPSAVVRFAQHFGFAGFSDLQAIFREAYASGAQEITYQQRIRAVIDEHPAQMKSADLARRFLDTCQSGLVSVSENLDEGAFEKAVDILQHAEHIYIMGVRRMFPVASYLAYVLPQTRKRVIFIDSTGGMYKEQVDSMSQGDVLLAISMKPYGQETSYCTELANQRGGTVLAITDNSLAPISRAAAVTLVVHEAEVYFFRAIACAMSLAQALFIALAYRLELDVERKDAH